MEILENIIQGRQINTDMIITMIVSLYGITIVMFLFKSIPAKIIDTVLYHFTTSVLISSMDDCYYSLIKLFQKNNIVNKARRLRLMNGKYGGSNTIDKSIGIGTHYFFYKKRPVKVRYNIETTAYSYDEKVHITLTKLGRSHKLFDELLSELQTLIRINNNVNEIQVYNFNSENYKWDKETYIRKRSFDTIFIEDGIKGRLLNHLDKFYSSEEWYHARGIPYQTGICLHGPAGTGKTSIVKGLASYYNKGLCVLRSSNIDKLPYALKRLPQDTFIVVEDIDTSSIVMERGDPEESLEEQLYRINSGGGGNNGDEAVVPEVPDTVGSKKRPRSKKQPKRNTEAEDIRQSFTKVLLSDVLNAMDGIISVEKRVIIFTTNHLEKLDKALIRPGRIDCLERIDYISFGQFIKFCRLFYKDTLAEKDEELFRKYSGLKDHVTVAELQRNFMQGMKLGEMMGNYCV
jgi:chaperone BCS1